MIETVITGMVAIAVCMINNHYQQQRAEAENDKTRALMEYKIDELTKKVEKHNNVMERTYLLEEKMKVANHRITDLEEKEK